MCIRDSMEGDGGDAEHAIQWSGADVDELHTPIRDRDEALERHAAGHDELIGVFGVTPIRLVACGPEPTPPGEADEHNENEHHNPPQPGKNQNRYAGGEREDAAPAEDQDPAEVAQPDRDALPFMVRGCEKVIHVAESRWTGPIDPGALTI